jgi:hypothetical protein
MEVILSDAIVIRMRRLAELEELARLAHAQAHVTSNHETSQVLHEISCKYSKAADERRAALAEGRLPSPNKH